ncbi:hypothetical protein DTO271D3_2542 [Paecilomyces variotii]|nr:hypothetical protein DTO212C5_553 [Paecilomyces variotii]KAJ9289133.1 hypothetical protein DTO021C3_3325 [Paecilomyces variotii]KAJ9317252.1 hypothetical protein DTO271D3_2542 [Paecilomyces variotii]KAJ9364154.1 hypothetical protein DTO280E4_1917 [Paecilomyces variotii]KAJ9396444.1 hypothetical protein DTO282F9_6579 [Paecilomyces variotii]
MSNYRYNPEPQVIESKYINPRALIELLRDVYGTSEKGQNNFLVELRLNRYKIYRPSSSNDIINARQISSCQRMARWR